VLEAVAQMVQNGTLEPHVTEVFPLDKADEALRLVEDGHATGKVVLEMA
jgi:NADPH:quinone reductase-like Zn-dependent oxidoreductase